SEWPQTPPTRPRSRAMVARAEAELGPVTILVNNAGVSWEGTLDTYDPEQVARMHQVNADGVIHATRAVMGSMRARRYGRIVNLASIAAIGTALAGNAFYAATKAKVVISRGVLQLPVGRFHQVMYSRDLGGTKRACRCPEKQCWSPERVPASAVPPPLRLRRPAPKSWQPAAAGRSSTRSSSNAA